MKQMKLPQIILFFCVPAIAIYLLFSFAYETMLHNGISEFWSVFVSLWSPILIMGFGVLALWKKSDLAFTQYFAVRKLPFKTMLMLVGVFVLVQLFEGALGFTRTFLANVPGFSVPEIFPAIFKPNFEPSIPMECFMGMPLKGNYGVIFLWALWLVVNIGGEELLWRGYALPRMQTYFGKWAWLVNGLLWNIAIHFFMRWSFITLLPISLVVPYFCQKYQSWIPGLIIHGLGNFLFYIILIPSVLQ